MSEESQKATETQTDQPQVSSSNYDIIRKRLEDQARQLRERTDKLNAARADLFGGTEMTVIGQERIRTENNCIPQDIVNVGGRMLFGYNVHIGLKTKTEVDDVFSLHAFDKSDDGFKLESVGQDSDANFLSDAKFVKDFDELYAYYKDARLRQLIKLEGRLLGIFQIGSTLEDRRVLRWGLDAQENVEYIDNAGDRDLKAPDTHDFQWQGVTRDDHVKGKHPHISILDEVFVETVGGDLTIKIEDNTDDGKGIYSEPVEDLHQSLGDGEFFWAKIGNLILLKILPYREEAWRYFVYNTLTQKVERLDAIGQSCIRLPEDQGVIFPGGFVLSNGQSKRFDATVEGLRIHQVIRSANGEDVLYVFYHPKEGDYLLLAYNVIRKDVQNPINCHGYSLFDDGTMIVFRFMGDEPTRIHPMQIWQTPFISDEHAAQQPKDDSLLSNIGNAELVRGISDAYSLCSMVGDLEPSMPVYEALIATAQKLLDAYFWLDKDEAQNLAEVATEIISTAELVIDEFQKVTALKKRAKEALEEAEAKQRSLFTDVRYHDWNRIERFVEGLDKLRKQRGHLITLKEMRYIKVSRLDELEAEVSERYDDLSRATVDFLLQDEALRTYQEGLDELDATVENLENTKQAAELEKKLDEINKGLNLLTEVISGLQIDDPTKRTKILENIGEVLSRQNRARARLERNTKELQEKEGKAEFAVQFQLFSQSVTSALGMCDTPEACDEQLTRLMVQLEELESRFSSFDGYLGRLAEKREEVYEVFESRKQALLEERQRKANNIARSADRILKGVVRRASNMKSVDDLNAYFASDAMVMKVRDLVTKLRELEEDVKADDITTQLKAAKDKAVRQLRDKLDLFEGGDNVIKFGQHRFSVNTQSPEMTMVPREVDGEPRMALHITGTDFFEIIDDEEFNKTRRFWDQHLISETDTVYRGEYLAASILFDAEAGENELTVAELQRRKKSEKGLQPLIREYMNERYDEGYERGVHDEDTAKILGAFLGMYATAGLLRFTPRARALATMFWTFAEQPDRRKNWGRRGVSLGRLREIFEHGKPLEALGEELAQEIEAFAATFGAGASLPSPRELEALAPKKGLCREAGRYLAEELVDTNPRFVESSEAVALRDKFFNYLDQKHTRLDFDEDLKQLQGNLAARWELVIAWLTGFADSQLDDDMSHLIPEVAALILTDGTLERQTAQARTTAEVTDLLGDHPRIDGGALELRLDEFLTRLRRYIDEHVPAYKEYKKLSRDLLERERRRLRVDSLEPQVFSGFVRNRLIDEVYLPLIGDNLAKQMGTVGEDSRSDRSGLLLLISPPGYGKTTLMEYIADRLGLMFMKINAPSLGHDVTSLDPDEAPNATARNEVEKINLALEMGNNVMLYLDDIQHTHPEFLQKFISLCDATRRIEGVWNGRTKTYDLRGKRFSVVMAGNPYTESGERFTIPDMLANRADTYNLGDILSGKQDAFEMSYIENALTSNKVTAPLVTRERQDIMRFMKMVDGQQIPLTEFDHAYSSVEAGEIVNVLEKLVQIRDVVLKVNQQYIISAGKKDEYRTEPPFQLQGSYRNMGRMTEKVASAMNDREVQEIIDNHYNQESQTLTTGSEQNLLKLAELRGTLTEEQKERWEEIKREYKRRKMMGGDDDPVSRVAGPLATLVQRLEDVHTALQTDTVSGELGEIRGVLEKAVDSAAKATAKKPSTVDRPKPKQQQPAATAPATAEALSEALLSLQQAKLEVQVVGDMPSKLGEVLESQLGLIESAILPLAKFVYREAEDDKRRDAQLDEVMRKLDALRGTPVPEGE
ncbi:DNA repair ATPase [Persicimonas caeni]|nr:DNA repair ATPase [Persicimonas caeni]